MGFLVGRVNQGGVGIMDRMLGQVGYRLGVISRCVGNWAMVGRIPSQSQINILDFADPKT